MSTAKTNYSPLQPAAPEASLSAHKVDTYHVFVASPGEVGTERLKVREFFSRYNIDYAGSHGPACAVRRKNLRD